MEPVRYQLHIVLCQLPVHTYLREAPVRNYSFCAKKSIPLGFPFLDDGKGLYYVR